MKQMPLLIKQLTKELLKNKLFVVLLLILTIFTPFMYFFVRFSVDGNILQLDAYPAMHENARMYQNALASNSILAANILAALSALTGFVFSMFFYGFFKAESRQLGCLKALGFTDATLRGFFIAFTAILSLIGALIGLGAGYVASDILLDASIESYQVTGLVKELHASSILIGLFLPTALFCLIVCFMYQSICGKQTALLLAGVRHSSAYTGTLRLANKIAGLCPAKNRLSVRLSLRKPIAVLLIVLSVTSFSVMFILAYSLTLSSQKVFESQTAGHLYLFDTHFDKPQRSPVTAADDVLAYLDASGTIAFEKTRMEQTVTAIEDRPALYHLLDADGHIIPLPNPGEIVISAQLQELYGLRPGDWVRITVDDNQRDMKISAVAFNAKTGCVYLAKDALCTLLSLPTDSFTGILSMQNRFEGGTVTTNAQKLDALYRGTVSNRSSALINQVIGCLVGCILLFLALLLNIKDSTRDILILRLMGYEKKRIAALLIDVYRPILCLAFFLTLWPAVEIVKAILRTLSLQIGDYMPFQTNLFVIGGIFLLLHGIYFLVQATFRGSVRRMIRKEILFEAIYEN